MLAPERAGNMFCWVARQSTAFNLLESRKPVVQTSIGRIFHAYAFFQVCRLVVLPEGNTHAVDLRFDCAVFLILVTALLNIAVDIISRQIRARLRLQTRMERQ